MFQSVFTINIFLIFSYILITCTSQEYKFVGKHTFPRFIPLSDEQQEAANEFQMIIPKNIIDHRKKVDIFDHYLIKSVSPRVINNDDVVTVVYETNSPSTSDWIAAYSPANVNISESVPIKYGYCDESDDYIINGQGALTFNLTNLRADVAFYYFTNSLTNPILVFRSDETVSFENINQPLRPRIVATGNGSVSSSNTYDIDDNIK